MGRRNSAERVDIEEVEPMHIDVRVAKIESDVAHIQSDVAEMKQDTRELRQDVKAVEARVESVRTELKDDIAALRTELKADIAALALSIEKLKGSMRAMFTAVIVVQLLAMGGAASALARVFGYL